MLTGVGDHLQRSWQKTGPLALLLLPLSGLFCLVAWLRRSAYQRGILSRERLPVPVIVVGNISVGGTGKTPLVVWLADYLHSLGYHPGVIARGYGGQSSAAPRYVDSDSDPRQVGDEPLLIARRSGVPVAVGVDRPAAARLLIEQQQCDIIVSDDGLQHYRLQRDIEIAVIDGRRLFGNGLCLPAGPLRERRARLRQVDLVIYNGGAGDNPQMRLRPAPLQPLTGDQAPIPLQQMAPGPVHAVAGIGDPARFFSSLRSAGIEVIEHPFADHHAYRAEDIRFGDRLPIIMTEKDAVKCSSFARPGQWFLPVDAELDRSIAQRLGKLLGEIGNG